MAAACSDCIRASLFVESAMKGRGVKLMVSGRAPVAASRRTQRYRDVPLMANHGLSTMVTRSLRIASALCSA